jgi:hypothetical protein
MRGPCMCGDPYCSSCGPAQGYLRCEHGAIQGDCGEPSCGHFGRTTCEYCGEPKVPGTKCCGNDQCIYGPDGKEAECCEGWSSYCCKCGYSYALGQM